MAVLQVSDAFALIFSLVAMHSQPDGSFCRARDTVNMVQLEAETARIDPQRLSQLRKSYADAKASSGAEPSTYEVIFTFGKEMDILAPGVTMDGEHALGSPCPETPNANSTG